MLEALHPIFPPERVQVMEKTSEENVGCAGQSWGSCLGPERNFHCSRPRKKSQAMLGQQCGCSGVLIHTDRALGLWSCFSQNQNHSKGGTIASMARLTEVSC